MIPLQAGKRNTAFHLMLGVVALSGVLLEIVPSMVHITRGGLAFWILLVTFYAAPTTGLFLWFKGFYHWSKAKGYPGACAFIGCLGFPFGPIVLACMKDLKVEPPPPDDPILNCAACGQAYRLGEYNPQAERIFCSRCKAELPRT